MAVPGYPPLIGPDDQVILFDGVCRLCNGWSRFILRYDVQRRFKLCPIQSEEGRAVLDWFGLSRDDPASMLLVQGDRMYSRTEAYLRIVRQLPLPWRLLAICRLFPRRLRDAVYNLIAARRYNLFGTYEYCPLPAANQNNRFLHLK